jgi:hypothetical protein
MPWGRICGTFAFHRKVLEVGNEGAGAQARMISYAAENLTGGKISRSAATTIAPQTLLDRMVAVGLLERDGDDYVIHDFGDFNPTGQELAKRRSELKVKRAEAGRRGAVERWRGHSKLNGNSNGNVDGKDHGNLPSDANGKHGKSDGKSDGKKMPTSPSPSPSQVPVPLERDSLTLAPPEPRPSNGSKGKRTKSYVPVSQTPEADVNAWCTQNGIPLPNANTEVAKMLDHFRANGEAKADWAATWRNWQRRAPEFTKAKQNGRHAVQQPPEGGSAWTVGRPEDPS